LLALVLRSTGFASDFREFSGKTAFALSFVK
jgi:hypothetical protein